MTGVRYGDRVLQVDVPSENLVFDIEAPDVPALSDYGRAIGEALAKPIGVPPLRHLVSQGQRVVIICDDYSRTTPTEQIVPLLLDELNRAGIPDGDVTVVIATGTHRFMSCAEVDQKLGSSVLSRVRVLQHDCRDKANLISFGTTRRGTTIFVNKNVAEGDVRIGVGSIFPHFPTGWSGGAKIVLPGVAGEETVAQMHLIGASNPHLGGEAESPMREEMEDFARAIGLDFVVNTVLNRRGEVVAVVAGDFVSAHRAGVEWARDVWGVPVSAVADFTISSTSPIDFDIGQAGKGVLSATLCTRPGGEIVLVSPCHEGFGSTHMALGDYMAMRDEEVWDMVRRGKAEDPVAAAIALNFWYARRRYQITIVNEGITPEVAATIGLRYVEPEEFSAYVRERLTKSPDLQVGILHGSAHIVPVVTQRHRAHDSPRE